MAYIGAAPAVGAFKKIDSIAGQQDDVETNFDLKVNSVSYTPESALQLLVVQNGAVLDPGSDYSVAGNILSFTVAPAANDVIFIIAYGKALFTGVPADGTVTNDKIASSTIAYDKLSPDCVGTIVGNIITYGI